MEKNDLSSKTVAELKALAKKMKITLSAGAKKADIIAALSPG
ncbi:MAG TPA: 50S ribosomal protein L21, partial [Nitrospiraceae bacterium]|nr:50S ribosomal protein L21 [Nitrospiraceae bacterium]